MLLGRILNGNVPLIMFLSCCPLCVGFQVSGSIVVMELEGLPGRQLTEAGGYRVESLLRYPC